MAPLRNREMMKNRILAIKKSGKRTRESLEQPRWTYSNQEISSDDNFFETEKEVENKRSDEESEEELENETAEEKRLRIAKNFLQEVEKELSSGSDEETDEASDEGNESINDDRVAKKLQEKRLASKGLLKRDIASEFESIDFKDSIYQPIYLSGHKASVTCVALSADDTAAFSGSKDNSVIKWDVETGSKTTLIPCWNRKLSKEQSHLKEILAIAVSTDSKYVAFGGRDKKVHVWDCRGNKIASSLSGHKDSVTSLAFRTDTLSLFSGSDDRCIKHWSLNEMGYVETLFGHQSPITSIDAFRQEKVVTGGRDNTARLWKLAEEMHLVFRPSSGCSIDAIAFVDNEHFVSGSDDGSLSIWSSSKKKPIKTVRCAHGTGTNEVARWICSIAALKSSDLLVSGSNDGFVRLWQSNAHSRKMKQVNEIPLEGFVNGLQISSAGKFIVAALGQEHRLGRWEKINGAKNKLCIIPLSEVAPTRCT